MATAVTDLVTELYKWLVLKKGIIIGIFVFLFVISLLGVNVKALIVTIMLAVLGIFSTVYKRYLRVPPAFELITFGTVLVGAAYGPVAGGIFGALVTLIAEIFNAGIDAFIIAYVPSRALIGVLAHFLAGMDIVMLGILMSFFYNILAQPLYIVFGDLEMKVKGISFIVPNLIINVFIFTILAPKIFPLL